MSDTLDGNTDYTINSSDSIFGDGAVVTSVIALFNKIGTAFTGAFTETVDTANQSETTLVNGASTAANNTVKGATIVGVLLVVGAIFIVYEVVKEK